MDNVKKVLKRIANMGKRMFEAVAISLMSRSVM